MVDWASLTQPFSAEDVKERPGRGGMTFTYVDARAVAHRLDEVLSPSGWDFTCSAVPGTEVVKGRLVIFDGSREIVREDHGYPNSDNDEEPIKSATSDALKRCAVLFGIGRHLYGDNKPGHKPAPRPTAVPAAPQRPVAVPSTSTPTADPDPYADLPFEGDEPVRFPPIGSTQPKVNDPCPIHDGEVWRGTPGDLWHGPKGVTPDGYCRPAGQPKKARAR